MPQTNYLNQTKPISPIRKVKCARGCGYERPYTDAPWWLMRVIAHPLYGPVNGQQIVEKDLWFHDCAWYLERQAHAREVTGYTGRIYSGSTSPAR